MPVSELPPNTPIVCVSLAPNYSDLRIDVMQYPPVGGKVRAYEAVDKEGTSAWEAVTHCLIDLLYLSMRLSPHLLTNQVLVVDGYGNCMYLRHRPME